MPENGTGGEKKRSRALVAVLLAVFACAFALLASGVLSPGPPAKNGVNGGNGGETPTSGNNGITWPERGTRLILEAEAALEIKAPMAPVSDGEASDRLSLQMPCASCTGAGHLHLPKETQKKASARLAFDVAEAGEYALWMRTKWCCECGDTFHIALDAAEPSADGPRLSADFGGDATNKGRWKWRALRLPAGGLRRIKLEPGRYRLTITPREDGWRVDQVLLTTDADDTPQGVERPETE